jgi:hypothetical protein
MNDVQPAIPQSAAADLGSASRLCLALVAGIVAKDGSAFLVAHNIITSADTAEVVSVGTGVLIGLGSLLWSKLRNIHIGQKLVAAAATGNPKADPSSPLTQSAITAAISDPSSPITAKALAIFLLFGALAVMPACSTKQMATAGTLTADAVHVAETVDPSISPAVAKACAYVAPVTQTAAAATKAKAIQQIALTAYSSCTPQGQKKLTENDKAAVQPDGGSAAWLGKLATAAQVLQALAPFIPLAMSFI